MKAIALFSGGLDSILAAKIISQQGIELEALHFYSLFLHLPLKEQRFRMLYYTEQIHIPLTVIDMSHEHLEIVKNPCFGYGRNINPCIDCKILMFRKGKEYMEESGASFIVSGEVVGQRPMSQRKDVFDRIEKETGLRGRILRPLSAKLLKPTLVEEKQWVKREELYEIHSRSRKIQRRLLEEFGIKFYANSSGGCLLTDPGYARRVKDLFVYHPEFGKDDVMLLRFGRHFRLSSCAKLIVPRDAQEADKLHSLYREGMVRFIPSSMEGVPSLGIGTFNVHDTELAAGIVASYIPRTHKENNISAIRGKSREVISFKKIDAPTKEKFLI